MLSWAKEGQRNYQLLQVTRLAKGEEINWALSFPLPEILAK